MYHPRYFIICELTAQIVHESYQIFLGMVNRLYESWFVNHCVKVPSVFNQKFTHKEVRTHLLAQYEVVMLNGAPPPEETPEVLLKIHFRILFLPKEKNKFRTTDNFLFFFFGSVYIWW